MFVFLVLAHHILRSVFARPLYRYDVSTFIIYCTNVTLTAVFNNLYNKHLNLCMWRTLHLEILQHIPILLIPLYDGLLQFSSTRC